MTGSEVAKRCGATIVKDYLHFGGRFNFSSLIACRRRRRRRCRQHHEFSKTVSHITVAQRALSLSLWSRAA